jgi:hypothetical protein
MSVPNQRQSLIILKKCCRQSPDLVGDRPTEASRIVNLDNRPRRIDNEATATCRQVLPRTHAKARAGSVRNHAMHLKAQTE